MGLPCRGIPLAYNKQTDILPFKVPFKASQTVAAFGYDNIFGHLKHDKGLGHLCSQLVLP